MALNIPKRRFPARAVLEMASGCTPHDISGKTGVSQKVIGAKKKKSLFGILDDGPAPPAALKRPQRFP